MNIKDQEGFAQQVLPSYKDDDKQFLDDVHAAIKGTEKDMVVLGHSGLTQEIIKGAIHELLKLRIPIWKFLMAESLYCDTLLWDITEELFKDTEFIKKRLLENVEAPKQLFGIPVVNTIKNDLVWDNRFYLFGIPEMLEKDLSNCIRITLK